MTGKNSLIENPQGEEESTSSKNDSKTEKKPSELPTTSGDPMSITRRIRKLKLKPESSEDTTIGNVSKYGSFTTTKIRGGLKMSTSMQRFMFTFGVGTAFAGHYVELEGSSEDTREEMFRLFGAHWAFQYDMDQEGQDLIEKWNYAPLAVDSSMSVHKLPGR